MKQMYKFFMAVICLLVMNGAMAQYSVEKIHKLHTPTVNNEQPYKKLEVTEFGTVTADSSVFLSGVFNKEITFNEKTLTPIDGGSAYLLKYAKDSTEAWGTYVEGAAKPQGMVAVNNNIVIALQIVGKQIIHPAVGENIAIEPKDEKVPNMLFVNFNSDGSVKWNKLVEFTKNADGEQIFVIESMKLTQSGNIAIGGNQSGTVGFDGDTIKAELYNMGQDQGWGMDYFELKSAMFCTILKSETGAFDKTNAIYSEGVAGVNSISLLDITTDKEDNIYVSAAAKGKIKLNDDKKWEVPVTDFNPQNGMFLARFSNTMDWAKMYVVPYRKESKSNQPIGKATGLAYTDNDKLIMAGVYNSSLEFRENVKLDSLHSGMHTDFFFAEVSPTTGGVVSATAFGTEGDEEKLLNAVSTQEHLKIASYKNDVFIMGLFSKTLQTPDGLELNSKSDTTDNFLLIYNTASNSWFAPVTFGGDSLDFASNIIVTANNKLSISGMFLGKTDMFGKELESTKTDDKYYYDSYVSVLGFKGLFNIQLADGIENGTITILPDTLNIVGTEINITATPSQGFELDTIIVYKKGDKEAIITVADNKFTMPEFDVVVDAKFKKKTGILKKEISKFKLYPNPTSNGFYLEGIEDNSTVNVYAITGKLVYAKVLSGEKFVDISSLPNGIYIIKVNDKTSRLVKM